MKELDKELDRIAEEHARRVMNPADCEEWPAFVLNFRSAIDQALALSREERFVYKQCQKHRDYLWPVMVVHSVPMPMKEVCPNCEERHVHSTGVPSEQRASSKAGGTHDLEITKLCAEAMGLCINNAGTVLLGHSFHAIYAPLTDDSQAMELVKRFELDISHSIDGWTATKWDGGGNGPLSQGHDDGLNRAIVKCVALMVEARTPANHNAPVK